MAGVVGSLGTTFNISALRTVGQISRYVLPTDGLWHGAIYYLEPSSFIGQRLGPGGEGGNPFFAVTPPSWQYLLWTGVWFLLVLTAGLVSFDRREL